MVKSFTFGHPKKRRVQKIFSAFVPTALLHPLLYEHQSPDGIAKAIYQSKNCKTSKTFDALDWLAQLTTHIPGKNEQMVRYYGYYSNKAHGMRRGSGMQDDVPALIDSELSAKEFRRNWARLLQKVYAVNPLICPKCQSEMKVISVIEDFDVTRKILKHLDLWEVEARPPPKTNICSAPEDLAPEVFTTLDDQQVPSIDDYLIDPEYPV